MTMYYLLLLLTLAGCAGAPYEAINDSDAASDGGDVGDLLGGRQHDSATDDGDAGMDQVADVDAATELGVDAAVTPGTDAAVAIDVDAAVQDATVPVSLGTTCDSCVADIDCESGYVCAYRSLDMAKNCFAVNVVGTDCPDVDTVAAFQKDPSTVCCAPRSNHTCAAYNAEWK